MSPQRIPVTRPGGFPLESSAYPHAHERWWRTAWDCPTKVEANVWSAKLVRQRWCGTLPPFRLPKSSRLLLSNIWFLITIHFVCSIQLSFTFVSLPSTADILNWGLLHQHFMSAFFVQKSFERFSQPRIWLWRNFHTKIAHAKCWWNWPLVTWS